jgi:hypothetical protein
MSSNLLRTAVDDFRSEQWAIGYLLVQRAVSGGNKGIKGQRFFITRIKLSLKTAE